MLIKGWLCCHPQVDQQLESAQQLVAQRRSNSPQRPYPVRPKNRVRNHSLHAGFCKFATKILIGIFCLNMKLKIKNFFLLRTQTCCQPSCAWSKRSMGRVLKLWRWRCDVEWRSSRTNIFIHDSLRYFTLADTQNCPRRYPVVPVTCEQIYLVILWQIIWPQRYRPTRHVSEPGCCSTKNIPIPTSSQFCT